MKLTVNGQPADGPDDQSVRDLVERLGMGKRPVAVEVNKQLVPRREHAATKLRDGDVVEIVTLVGGG